MLKVPCPTCASSTEPERGCIDCDGTGKVDLVKRAALVEANTRAFCDAWRTHYARSDAAAWVWYDKVVRHGPPGEVDWLDPEVVRLVTQDIERAHPRDLVHPAWAVLERIVLHGTPFHMTKPTHPPETVRAWRDACVFVFGQAHVDTAAPEQLQGMVHLVRLCSAGASPPKQLLLELQGTALSDLSYVDARRILARFDEWDRLYGQQASLREAQAATDAALAAEAKLDADAPQEDAAPTQHFTEADFDEHGQITIDPSRGPVTITLPRLRTMLEPLPATLYPEPRGYIPARSPRGMLNRALLEFAGDHIEMVTAWGPAVAWELDADPQGALQSWLAAWRDAVPSSAAGFFVVEGVMIGTGEDAEFDYDVRGLSPAEIRLISEHQDFLAVRLAWSVEWADVPCKDCAQPLSAHREDGVIAGSFYCPGANREAVHIDAAEIAEAEALAATTADPGMLFACVQYVDEGEDADEAIPVEPIVARALLAGADPRKMLAEDLEVLSIDPASLLSVAVEPIDPGNTKDTTAVNVWDVYDAREAQLARERRVEVQRLRGLAKTTSYSTRSSSFTIPQGIVRWPTPPDPAPDFDAAYHHLAEVQRTLACHAGGQAQWWVAPQDERWRAVDDPETGYIVNWLSALQELTGRDPCDSDGCPQVGVMGLHRYPEGPLPSGTATCIYCGHPQLGWLAEHETGHPDFVDLLYPNGWVVHIGDPVTTICKLRQVQAPDEASDADP